MEKVKRFPWLYLVIYDKCPVSVYSVAWRALACVICLVKEGFDDLDKFKVIRYRLSSSSSSDTEREVVTDSFLRSIRKYGLEQPDKASPFDE